MASVFDLAGARYKTDISSASFKKMDPHAPRDYRELAVVLVNYWRQHDHKVIGLSGGQGAGKSTLSDLIQVASMNFGEQVVVLGLDDFYLTQSERKRLATEKHELFATRGPPGTHDIGKLLHAIDEIAASRSVEVPQFDKGADERIGTRKIDPPCHRVLIEGWCVGARPQPKSDLSDPINTLESEHDRDRRWRHAVNEYLSGSYAHLCDRLDGLVYLRVPDIDSVKSWRLQQESDREPAQRRDMEWISRFVEHYQRITEWMYVDAASRADVLVELDTDHRVSALTLR